jgi:hypothetical protein
VTTIKKSERPDFLKLRAAAKDARDLAQRLFKNETTGMCWNMRQVERMGKEATAEHGCLEREDKRLTGWPKLPQGSTMRGYGMFDPGKLCGACCSYWHIEMGAQELARLVAAEQHIAAEEKRELPKASNVTKEGESVIDFEPERECRVWCLSEQDARDFFGAQHAKVRVIKEAPETEREKERYRPEAKLYGVTF